MKIEFLLCLVLLVSSVSAGVREIHEGDLSILTFMPYEPVGDPYLPFNLRVECEGECDLPRKIGCVNYGKVGHSNQWVCESLINSKPLKVDWMTIRCNKIAKTQWEERVDMASCTLVIETKPAPLFPSWLTQVLIGVPGACIAIWGSDRAAWMVYSITLLWVLAQLALAASHNPRMFTHLTYV